MRFLTSKSAVALSSVLLLCGTALAAVSLQGAALGWAPLVSLWGRGDPAVAVRSLKQVTSAYEVMLHHTEIDKPTQKFIDDALKELEDFDLKGFHDLLPEKGDGFRKLSVRGDLQGKRYVVGRATSSQDFEVGLKGPRRELGAMSATLRSSAKREVGEYKSYLLGGRLGLGLGPLSWRALTDAVTDQLRLASVGDPRPGASEPVQASEKVRTTVKALNPGLGEEDVQVLALLYEAYPQVAQQLSLLGRVEDVRTAHVGMSYQHLTIKVRGLPERLKQRFPDLAKHLRKLGDLARADARWMDSQGRTLVHVKAQTDGLTAVAECYVKDGKILPFKRDQVFEDEPVDLMGQSLAESRIVVDARVEMLGVVVKLDKLRADFAYVPRENYASIDARFNSVPGIRIEGRALGFLPTRLVDAFIPGNIESLTRDFFTVAAKGNGGKGVVVHADVGSQEEGAGGVLVLSADVEALDNFLVKMGVGVVNNRVLPDDDVIADGKRFAAELHDAFVKDLTRFQGQLGG